MAKNSKFYEKIKNSCIEREVEDVYNIGLQMYFQDAQIMHPYACDGLIDTKVNNRLLKLIIEYKYDESFTSKTVKAKVLAQVLFYLKQFELNGQILPNVLMIADKNECFVMHTNALLKYMDEQDVNWSQAPSGAASSYPELVLKIAQDEAINPFVFDVNENFSFKDVAEKIKDIASNTQRLVRITEHNMVGIYDIFLHKVLKPTKKIKSQDLVGAFIGTLTDHDNYYKHPTKKNTLITPIRNYGIDGAQFDSFFSYFQREYSPQEKRLLHSIADRLVEDSDRRNTGDFWTPTIWVDYAHKMISQELGDDWKEKYVVWDNCCGTKNLTRDYRFKELYSSTLFQSELDMANKYNMEGTSFQFDFLNDYFPMPDEIETSSKVPQGLIDALKANKPFVFFLNPPYGRGTGGMINGAIAGCAESAIQKRMKTEHIDSSELLRQFLYRITKIKQAYNLTNCYIGIFSKPCYITKSSCKSFRQLFLSNFAYKKGIMFQASEFGNVSGSWGITFNIWSSGETLDKNNFLHKLCKRNEDTLEIEELGEHALYNLDNSSNMLPINNLNIDNICTIKGNRNDVSHNNYINIADPNKEKKKVSKENLILACVQFAIHKCIEANWINDKDLYIIPNYIPEQFKLDCLVYSTFHNYCCSYQLGQDRLKNEFFWMSKDEILELANDNNNDDCYNDALTTDERYVYTILRDRYNELSEPAKALLEAGKALVRDSFKYRILFNEEEPKYQINNWDAGWYQIKQLCNMYMPERMKEFRKQFNAFSKYIEPQVYDLGFLRK